MLSSPLLSKGNGSFSFCPTICIYNANSKVQNKQKKNHQEEQKQKLYYDAYAVPTARNLIHLLEVEEICFNSKLTHTDTAAAVECNG